jgi:hypothetical protein
MSFAGTFAALPEGQKASAIDRAVRLVSQGPRPSKR